MGHSKATSEGSSAWAMQASPKSGTANLKMQPNSCALPGSVPIKRELSSQSDLGDKENSTPPGSPQKRQRKAQGTPKKSPAKVMKRKLSPNSVSQPHGCKLKRRLMTPQAMKRGLVPGKVSNASQVSQPKRRKLCKQPPKRAHSNTFNDEAIAQAMQNSSQE